MAPNSTAAWRGGMPSDLAKCCGVAGPYAYRYRVTSARRAASPSAGRKPGSQRRGWVQGPLRAPAGPEQGTPPGAARPVGWGPRGPLPPTPPPRRPATPPPAGPIRDRRGQLIDGQLSVRQRVTDGRDDLLRLPGGEPDPVWVRWHRRGQGRQRARPHRQVGGGQQVDGAARAERLDQ